MRKKLLILLTTAVVMITALSPASAETVDSTSEQAKTPVVEKVLWRSAYTHKTLSPGKKFRLKAKCLPDNAPQKIVYYSSKPSVVTVSGKGIVTAKNKGKAIIFAKAKGTNIKAKYYIHVGKKVKKLTRVNAKYKKTIYTGSRFKLKVKCKPNNAAYRKVGFTSSKPSVATVSKNGVITAKKNGQATITAKALDQSGKKVKCRITVKTKVRSIKLSSQYMTCFIGQKLKIKSKISPSTASNKGLTWKSSNKKVATVSQKGYVNGKKSGNVTITATSKENKKKKAKYKVFVRGPLDPSTEFFVAHRGLSSKYPENTIQSFSAAGDQNFSGIETDIWENEEFYSDDPSLNINPQFVIMHDSTLTRMCGVDKKVSELNENNINDYVIVNGNGNSINNTYNIPILDDFIEIISNSSKTAFIEIKENDLTEEGTERLISLIDDNDIASRTFIISFNKDALLRVKAALNGREDIKLCRLLGKESKNHFLEEIDWSISSGMDVVSISGNYIEQEYIDKIKDAGLIAGAWTIDDKNEAADLIMMGVDQITTNSVLW